VRVGKKVQNRRSRREETAQSAVHKTFLADIFCTALQGVKHDCGYKSENKLQAKVFKFVGHKY